MPYRRGDVIALRDDQQFEDAPVMITQVEDEAEQPLVRHGFRMETLSP